MSAKIAILVDKNKTEYWVDGRANGDITNFVDDFSKEYFSFSQNTMEKEKRILEIVNKGQRMTSEDVIYLMRWKLNDKNSVGNLYNCYGKKISVECGSKIAEEFGKIKDLSKAMLIYERLLNLRITGFGTVYLLTLVWAVSGMKYPIYDKYADIATRAIYSGKCPRDICYLSPPDKNQLKFVEKKHSSMNAEYSFIPKGGAIS